MKKIFAFIILFLLFTQVALAEQLRTRYLVFAKRAAIRGVLLMDVRRWKAFTTKELEEMVLNIYDKERIDGLDIKRLTNMDIITRELQRDLGKQPGLSLSNVGYTQTMKQWEEALKAEYPDLFIEPTSGIGP